MRARSNACSTVLNCSNNVILYNSRYYSLFKRSLPPVVLSTISRLLAQTGLRSNRPLRRLPLTPQYQRNRLEWCQSPLSWLPSDYIT
ncbi:hypothetical protein TNCV_3948031 [Trichonephila clavipes]|nr:hypothetical protein TNCV_3948031 [Trichonephila clavipes]